jgi:hypothetical protein
MQAIGNYWTNGDGTRFRKLLARASSDNDPEAIAAFRNATRILARYGITWTLIAKGAETGDKTRLMELLALAANDTANDAASDAGAIAALREATSILTKHGMSWTDVANNLEAAMKSRQGKSTDYRSKGPPPGGMRQATPEDLAGFKFGDVGKKTGKR